jgi:hypothetical protein
MADWWESDPVAKPEAGGDFWKGDPVAEVKPITGGAYAAGLGQVGSDLPIIGPATRKFNAAVSAAIAPVVGDKEVSEPTFLERYQHILGQQEKPLEAMRQQYPVASGLANFGGTLAASIPFGGSPLLGGGATSFAGQVGRGLASGGAISATDAALRGEDPVTAGVTGAALGAAAPAVVRAIAPALPVAKAVAPTTAEHLASAKAGYQHPIVKDVAFKPQAVSGLADTIESDLVGAGFRPRASSAGGVFSELGDMRPGPGVQSVGVDDLDNIRKGLQVYAKQRDAVGMPTTEAAAAGRAIAHIDDFLPNLKQPDLLRGDAQAASKILTDARGDYRAYKQAQIAETKMENARIQAASTYGGGNINNALRQAYRPLEVNNFAKSSNWSPAAQAALKDVVEGGRFGNLMRDLGRGAPSGLVGTGKHFLAAHLTGGLTLPLSAGAFVAKKIGDASTGKAATRLSEVIRSESPLARKQAPTTNLPALIGQQGQSALQALLRAQSLRGASTLPLQQSTPLYFPPGP